MERKSFPALTSRSVAIASESTCGLTARMMRSHWRTTSALFAVQWRARQQIKEGLALLRRRRGTNQAGCRNDPTVNESLAQRARHDSGADKSDGHTFENVAAVYDGRTLILEDVPPKNHAPSPNFFSLV